MSKPDQQVTDLLFLHSFTAGALYEPASKGELVAAVATATANGRSLRALGSNYSLSAAAVADDVVDTEYLNMHICQPYLPGTAPLNASRLRDGGSSFLSTVCASDQRAAGRYFVHVEAGVKIKDLLDDLGGCGLALPTMGAGGGQSLAGAFSTGTHGADFQVPPLVEWIRAVHLVGPAGQEWWITPTESIFAAARITTLPDWCQDARVVANDDAFDAVRVAVGRMGIIYSVILEVVAAYTLIEVNLEHRWADIRARLSQSGINGGTPTGIFDQPLIDLDSGWFRTEVLERTIFRSDPSQNQVFTYEPGPPKWPAVPAYFDANPQVYVDMLSRRPASGGLGLSGLADDLRGGAAMPLHHMNLGISLPSPDRCWITRRWRRQDPVRPVGLQPDADDPVVAALKANKTNPSAIVGPLQDQIEVIPELDFLGDVTHDAKEARLDWYLDSEIARSAADSAARHATSGEALILILNELALDPVLDAKADVSKTVSDIIAKAAGPLVRAGPASGGLNQNIPDKHDYGLDYAQSGNSAEFHFDASSGVYLDFIDAVINLAYVHSPVFGYIGVRFTPGATAFIAMQQFSLTASVEVATARTRVQDIYAGFWNDVHDAANARGGIPHWGQEFRQSAEDLDTRYGDRLTKWRGVLADLVEGSPKVFSTAFSRDKGLEPTGSGALFDDDAIDQFLLGLEGGDDYARSR